MFSALPETRCEGDGIMINIYVWKGSELDGMSSTVEEVKGIVGTERVVISVNPESKKEGPNL